MLREFKEKEFNRLNSMIDSYQKDINDLAKQAESIDEKYRKIIEEEKKNLTEALDYYRSLQTELIAKRDALGLETPVVDKNNQKKMQEESEEKEQVMDMLFPENNEDVADPEPEVTEEETHDEPDAPEESDFPEADEPAESEGTVEVEDIWADDTQAEEDEESEDEDEGWPDVVEEWK